MKALLRPLLILNARKMPKQCVEVRSLPWSKVKRSFREVFKDYFNVLQIILLISATRG